MNQMTDEDPAAVVADDDEGDDDERICKITEETNASRRKAGGTDSSLQEKKLRQLLTPQADDIQSIEHFTYWKDTFLSEYRQYCDRDATAIAREADKKLYARMEVMGKQCLKVKALCKSGAISAEKSSVKGQNSLNEMVAIMAKTETYIRDFMPKTTEDEEKAGYSKFELAAILIRDDFRVYAIMLVTRDYIIALSEGPLAKGDLLRVNSKNIMNFYLKSIVNFCDTMADLGLHRLMEKCVELYSIRPRKKKKKIYARTKEKDPLSDTSDEDTPNKGRMFRRSKVEFRAVMDNGWTSGVSGKERMAPVGAKKLGDGDTWGEDEVVKVTKPEKEKATDYIYYLDPVTEKVGKIPRETCLKERMVVSADDEGKEVQEGRVEEWDGEEGQAMMIWKFKEILKGHSLKEKAK
jgi:hypothetical protein